MKYPDYAEKPKLPIDRVFSEGWSIAWHAPVRIIGLFLLMALISQGARSSLERSAYAWFVAPPWEGGPDGMILVDSVLSGLAGPYILLAMLQYAGLPRVRESFQDISLLYHLRFFWVSVVISTLAGLLFYPFVLPSLLPFIFLSFAYPVILSEDRGIVSSLGRSADIALGNVWRLALLYFLPVVLAAFILLPLDFLLEGHPRIYELAETVMVGFLVAWLTGIAVAAYARITGKVRNAAGLEAD